MIQYAFARGLKGFCGSGLDCKCPQTVGPQAVGPNASEYNSRCQIRCLRLGPTAVGLNASDYNSRSQIRFPRL